MEIWMVSFHWLGFRICADDVDRAMHDAVPAIAAVGVSPIVRLPDMQSFMVKRTYYWAMD